MRDTATIMVARALGHEAHDGDRQLCGLCGALASCRPSGGVLKPTFTNCDELRSPWVCWACEVCLSDRAVRSHHLVDHDGFHKLNRLGVWHTLYNPPPPPFVLYATHSGKKHGLFRQAIATSPIAFRVQVEQLGGWFDRPAATPWVRVLVQLVADGARRESVATGHYTAHDYRTVGVQPIRGAEHVLQPVRTIDLFVALHGLLPAKDKLPEVLTWMSATT